MSCCKVKDTFFYIFYKLDSLAQWQSARLGIQGSWVRFLFQTIFFHPGVAKKGPKGDPKNDWDDIRDIYLCIQTSFHFLSPTFGLNWSCEIGDACRYIYILEFFQFFQHFSFIFSQKCHFFPNIILRKKRIIGEYN